MECHPLVSFACAASDNNDPSGNIPLCCHLYKNLLYHLYNIFVNCNLIFRGMKIEKEHTFAIMYQPC